MIDHSRIQQAIAEARRAATEAVVSTVRGRQFDEVTSEAIQYSRGDVVWYLEHRFNGAEVRDELKQEIDTALTVNVASALAERSNGEPELWRMAVLVAGDEWSEYLGEQVIPAARRLLRLHARAIDRVAELLALGMNLNRNQVTEIVADASLPNFGTA